MKSSKFILALWLGASAWAQTLPLKQPVTPAVSAKPAMAKPTAAPVSPKVAPVHRSKPDAGTPVARVHRSPKKRSGKLAAQSFALKKHAVIAASGPATPNPKALRGHRDPFVSPVVERIRATAACTGTGRQCLLVGEITLQGVVRSNNGLIAVVMNGEHTYFLRENDPLADGAVQRITKDSIVLRERSTDALGRPFTREVIRKLGTPAV